MAERYFAARLDELAEYLAPFAVIPDYAQALMDADDEVDNKVYELTEALGSPDREELAELGVRVAKGELKPETVRARISSAADMTPAVMVHEYGSWRCKQANSRRSVVVEAAKQQWREQLDRPEWSPAGLRKACVPKVQGVLDAAAVELKESWEQLPQRVRDEVLASRGQDLRSVAASLNVNMTGEELDARKRAADVWMRWFNAGGDLIDAFHYLHGGKAAITREGERVKTALCFLPRDAAKFYAAGFTPSQLFVRGMIDGFDPIADPLGADSEEYQARLAEYNHVQEWKYEFNAVAESGINIRRETKQALLRRRELHAEELVSAMQRAGEWHD